MQNTFSNPVEKALSEFLEKTPPGIACFDADGTLWAGDANESFLQRLITEGVVPDIWEERQKLVAVDPEAAYAFDTRAMANVSEEEIISRATRFFLSYQKHVFPMMQTLLHRFLEKGHTVWIVSGSNRWLIEVAAEKLGLDPKQTIAQAVQVENGILLAKDIAPTIFGEGKVQAILERIGKPPAFSAGNSWSDVKMLEMATHLSLLINPTRLIEGEEDIVSHAQSRGWLIEIF